MKLDLGDYLFVWHHLGRRVGDRLFGLATADVLGKIGDGLSAPSVGNCRVCLVEELQAQQ